MLESYFRKETAQLTKQCLKDIHSLEDWEAQREANRRELQEMLGLWPMPERTDLHPVVTGRIEQQDFSVEKVQFQAAPQLYVTANLYLPKPLGKSAPAILYLCGHSRGMVTNGLSLGNKTGYQHHGAWFARNGYVCLVVDSLELGEIPGIHSGTRALGRWWWNSRGYTPAGVEAWFGIRALDYLCSRPEVDAERIGLTGRSGGGSYSWNVAALDDRVKVVCPIAGMTDLQSHVVGNCVDGHCDCMFFLNTYRWDFPQVAALIAPRPLLIGNSDKDKGFPLDGAMRLHEKVREIYQLYGAAEQLSILITDGPHKDTQELQLPVMRWFNRFLKGEESLVETAAKKIFSPEQLRVFGDLPAGAINAGLPFNSFPPSARPPTEMPAAPERLIASLKEKTFGGWPREAIPFETKLIFSVMRAGVRLSAWDFMSQHDVRLRLYLLEERTSEHAKGVCLTILDQLTWTNWLGAMSEHFASELNEELSVETEFSSHTDDFEKLKLQLKSESTRLAFFAPRGVGLTTWPGDEKRQTGIRRRFMLLGQTLDGMRVWDIRRAVQLLPAVRPQNGARVELHAQGDAAVNCLYAALFESGVHRLELTKLPFSQVEGPDYLNILRLVDLPQVVEQVATRAEVVRRP
jgi:dienelactone hydrolase